MRLAAFTAVALLLTPACGRAQGVEDAEALLQRHRQAFVGGTSDLAGCRPGWGLVRIRESAVKGCDRRIALRIAEPFRTLPVEEIDWSDDEAAFLLTWNAVSPDMKRSWLVYRPVSAPAGGIRLSSPGWFYVRRDCTTRLASPSRLC